ncbi:hypothetical protein NW768_005761 [Fusarium equiseti]|uniref:Uncharacterized protein n=1 Tax=Fusarium equiseti TaxID=61235 RepID=A0ABQ8RCU1_FUSEQ|nr:hypothetical protein NW768_005761 [Fusarium equiseti]
MPDIHHDHFREEAQLNDSSKEPDAKRSASQVVADQVSILEMVREDLRHLRSQTSSPEPVLRPIAEPELTHKQKPGQESARSTSSSYPEDGIRSPNVPSPSDSHTPLSTLGDLEKYSRINDRLSGLRSSSSSSGATRVISQGSSYKALTNAVGATRKLQRLPTPSYHRFEVLSSSEDLMANIIAPHNSEASHESEFSIESADGRSEMQPLRRVIAHDRLQNESPSPSVKLPQIIRLKKRKASGISFRSISEGVKRSRIEIKKLAVNVCSNSWDKLRQARENIKRQRKDQKKHHSVWRALRRKLNPGDTIKDKHEDRPSHFSMGNGFRRHVSEHKSWWKAGVEKYQAPEWMHFGNQTRD